jgi:hypothetical protein
MYLTQALRLLNFYCFAFCALASCMDDWDPREAGAALEALWRVLRYSKIRHHHGWSDVQVLEFVQDVTIVAVLGQESLRRAVVAGDRSEDCYLGCAIEQEPGSVVSGDRHLVGLARYEGSGGPLAERVSRRAEQLATFVRLRPLERSM